MDTAHNKSYKYLKIQDLAKEDRPREKLITKGASVLSNAELIAILLGSGTQNITSIDLAKQLLKSEDHCLGRLCKRSVQELTKYHGIGYAKAATIASAIELSKRIKEDITLSKPIMKSSEAAYHLVKSHFVNKVAEEAWVMLFNRRNQLIKNHQVSKGGLATTTMDPKVVFKAALDHHAHAIIITHNHPSGDLRPSELDMEVTTNLLHGAKYLGITLHDHLIITESAYFSFRDNALL